MGREGHETGRDRLYRTAERRVLPGENYTSLRCRTGSDEDDPPRRPHSRQGDIDQPSAAQDELGLARLPETRSTASGEDDRVEVADHSHLTDNGVRAEAM
jgi:hypothetical protein